MLKGERVLLRARTRDDLSHQVKIDNDLEIRLLASGSPPVPYSLDHLESFFERQLKQEENTWFAIEVDKRFIGYCALHDFNLTHRTCQLGITIGEKEYWNRGYGREAVQLLLDYAFRYRNMRKVWLSVGNHNERAIRCYHACGFKEEGRLRQHQWCNGQYVDLVQMGLLYDEWLACKRRPSEGLP